MSDAMRADRATSLGQQGELEVAAQLAAFGWGPVRTELGSDLGTDIYAQIRDDRLYDVGLLLSLQVKTGSSYFSRPASADVLGRGWWHEERNYSHFESWVQHTIPHILVLRNVELGVSYWAHVNRDSVVSMDKGTKIFVPETQVLSEEFRHKLVALAASQREREPLEGSIWRGDQGRRFSPATAFRTALICPRLVAPHGNQSTRKVEPEEIVALCVLGRIQEVPHYLRDRTRTPRTLSTLSDQKSFRWKFAHQMVLAAQDVSFSFSRALHDDAPSSHGRVASGMLHVSTLMRQDKLKEALAFLENITRSPRGVDQAWVLAQKARCLLLLGERRQALETAQRAKEATQLYGDDQTATAIAGAAESIAFESRHYFSSESLEAVAKLGDTAASWWRSQQTVTGLTSWTERAFKEQFQSRSITIGAADTPLQRLRGAMWITDFSADEPAWRNAASLYAKYLLGSRHSAERDVVGLDLLRQMGEHRALKLAAEYLWRLGPTEALSTTAGMFASWRWTGGTFRANLVLLDQAADLLSESRRESAVGILRDALLDPDNSSIPVEDIVERADVLRTLHSLGTVSRESAVQNTLAVVVVKLLSQVEERDGLEEAVLGDLASSLQVDVLDDEIIDKFVSLAGETRNKQLSADLLSLLMGHRRVGRESEKKLIARANQGEVEALRRTPRALFYAEVQASRAASLVSSQIEEVKRLRESVAVSASFSGPPPAPSTLALLFIDYPQHAQWSVVEAFIADQNFPRSYKRDVCTTLAAVADSIPEDVRQRISNVVSVLDDHPIEFAPMGRLAGGHVQLLAALGVLADEQIAPRIMQLAKGDGLERSDAAAAASYWKSSVAEGLLVALSSDGDVRVRATAISGMFQRGSSAIDLPKIALNEILDDPGVSVPMQILQSWSSGEFRAVEIPVEALRGFKLHKSASIRMNADALLHKRDSGTRIV